MTRSKAGDLPLPHSHQRSDRPIVRRSATQTMFTRFARNIGQQQASIASMTCKTISPDTGFAVPSSPFGVELAHWPLGMLTKADPWHYGDKWQTTSSVMLCRAATSFLKSIPHKRRRRWPDFSTAQRLHRVDPREREAADQTLLRQIIGSSLTDVRDDHSHVVVHLEGSRIEVAFEIGTAWGGARLRPVEGCVFWPPEGRPKKTFSPCRVRVSSYV